MANKIKYWSTSHSLIEQLEKEIEKKQTIIKFERIKNFHNSLMRLAPKGYSVTLGLRGGYVSLHINVAYINIKDENGMNVVSQKPLAEDEDEDRKWDFRPTYHDTAFKKEFESMIKYLLTKEVQPHLLELVRSIDEEKGPDGHSRDEYSFDYSITPKGWKKTLSLLLGEEMEEFFITEEQKSLNGEIPSLSSANNSAEHNIKNKI